MAYDPADLRLPHWLLNLFDFTSRIRVPIWRGWRLGFTRPGILYMSALFGVWAASLYSGNNLLYLCGAMILMLAIAGVSRGISLLRRLPKLSGLLPFDFEAESVYAIRERIACNWPHAAVIEVVWIPEAGGDETHLQLRVSDEEALLRGRLEIPRRGVYAFLRQRLVTEAPLGMWRLEWSREEDAWQQVVLPRPSYRLAAAGSGLQSNVPQEGDEWRDLRQYAFGDPLSRIHWRKSVSFSAQTDWTVKRFGTMQSAGRSQLLRVDLRMPEGMRRAFEAMLAEAYGWMLSMAGEDARIVIGRREFRLSDADEHVAALMALASAVPELQPPIGDGGQLLSIAATNEVRRAAA